MSQVESESLNDDPVFPLAYYADALDSHSQIVVITLWIGCVFLNENWPFYSLRLVPACLITSIAYAISFLITTIDLPKYQYMRISSGILIVGITLWLTWESIAELVTEFCFAQIKSLPEHEQILETQQLSRAQEPSNEEQSTPVLEETMPILQTQQKQQEELSVSTNDDQSALEETMPILQTQQKQQEELSVSTNDDQSALEETMPILQTQQKQQKELFVSTNEEQSNTEVQLEEMLAVDQRASPTGKKSRSRKHRRGRKSQVIQNVSRTGEDKSIPSQQTTNIFPSTSSTTDRRDTMSVSSLNLEELYTEIEASNDELNRSFVEQETSNTLPVTEKSTCEDQVLRSPTKPEKKHLKTPVLPKLPSTSPQKLESRGPIKVKKQMKRKSRKSK